MYGDTAPAVTSMSLVFKPAEGKQLSGIGFYIDYFRTDFDTRCAQNNAIFLDSIAEYYRYTGDDAYLAQMLETLPPRVSVLSDLLQRRRRADRSG